MKAALRTLFGLLIVMAFAAALNASDKYFFHKDGKAYYCRRPAKPTPGVFVVCDDPSVVKIDHVPTITTARCKALLKQAAPVKPTAAKSKPQTAQPASRQGLEVQRVAYQVTLPIGRRPSPCDCISTGPGPHHDCFPHLGVRCYCHSRRVCECFHERPGGLEVKCVSNSFYRGIKEFEAVVPVPELCVVEDEQYIISPVIYRYDCSKYADKCKDIDCDFTDVDCRRCEVHTCRVYKRCTQCRVECRLVNRRGAVLIAVCRELVNGQLVAATGSEISRRLGIPGLNLATIAGGADLRTYLGPSQPCN